MPFATSITVSPLVLRSQLSNLEALFYANDLVDATQLTRAVVAGGMVGASA